MTSEESAGCLVVDGQSTPARALLIRVRRDVFEIPKGHIEAGETPEDAALRELSEETGLLSSFRICCPIGTIAYEFETTGGTIQKQVHYFLAVPTEPMNFGPLPSGTRERRWITQSEMELLPLVNESLREIIRKGLNTPFTSAHP